MLKIRYLLFALLFALSLCGCAENSGEKQYNGIFIGEKQFTVEEITCGIKETFNSVAYFQGDSIESSYLPSYDRILGKPINYKLYYNSGNADTNDSIKTSPRVHFVLTDIEHPLSSEGNILLYEYSINLTEHGLASEFYSAGNIPKESTFYFINESTVDLGEQVLLLDELKKPEYKEKDAVWKNNSKAELIRYMDKNDFYCEESKNLAVGKYRVYVQNFTECDTDTKVFFQHEQGDVYMGYYYFVHEASAEHTASLNHVEKMNAEDKEISEDYLKKVYDSAALIFDYTIE